MADFPTGEPVRARLIPRNRRAEIEVWVLGEGMVEMLRCAEWVRSRHPGYSVPWCDDLGLLLRHQDDDGDAYHEWCDAGVVLVWNPPGSPDGGLYGTVGQSYLADYEPIGEGE